MDGKQPDATTQADLNHAGAVVDKGIEYMMGQNIGSMAIASALLGGAVGLLARTLDDAAIIQVLSNAIAGVRSGELRRDEREPGDFKPGDRGH